MRNTYRQPTWRMMAVATALCALAGMGAWAEGSNGEVSATKAIEVPMAVDYSPAWLTWIASTTGCLNALGVDCDMVDVAGYSGYAFMINVAEDLCPSGPTAFDWGTLSQGPRLLGRSTLWFQGATCGGNPGDFRAAYELVKAEVEAGRPCVLWGTYVPEFGIATGVQGDAYLVKTFRPFAGEPEPPIPFDELAVPGGACVFAFPAAVEVDRETADRIAVQRAVELFSGQTTHPEYRRGEAAYDLWIAALGTGRAGAFGNSYNAQCWAEAKRFACNFVGRLADRNEVVAEPLHRAQVAYAEAADAMGKVADLFPFPDTENKVGDPEVRAKAMEALTAAKEAEGRATAALAEAAGMWLEPPTELEARGDECETEAESVMTGIEDTLREIVARFSPAVAKGLKATYQLRLTGEGGGEWHIKISDGKCELVGGAAEEADVGISASVEDWRGILTGEVDAMDVFYQGRLQLSGNLELALRLQELFVL